MKLIALATALTVAGTAAIAQDTAPPPPAPPPAEMAPPPPPPPGPPGPTPPPPAAGEDPAGGYMPSTPALSGQPTPGQQVTFQPAPSPTEAYPPPAPMQTYPVCKKGQYDDCRQRGG